MPTAALGGRQQVAHPPYRISRESRSSRETAHTVEFHTPV